MGEGEGEGGTLNMHIMIAAGSGQDGWMKTCLLVGCASGYVCDGTGMRFHLSSVTSWAQCSGTATDTDSVYRK